MADPIVVTCKCAPNIALIKYWGKSDQSLILPLNGSLSITLDNNVISTRTTIVLLSKKDIDEVSFLPEVVSTKKIQIWFENFNQEFDEDEQWSAHNETKEFVNIKRFLLMLNKVRENCGLENPSSFFIRIRTTNSFPTACGLASSASGFACLAMCLAEAFKYNGDVSELARLGSGSACRSCFGGFVLWSADRVSENSIARRLYFKDHWPEMNILVLILEDERKKISSRHGMQTSVLTSDLLEHRVKLVEDRRLLEMQSAINYKDFNKVGKLAMRDSNTFHAVCMDTYPPLFYLNEKSKEIIRFINEFNRFEAKSTEDLKAFYSFDAGPNAFLFVQDENLNELLYLIYKFYFSSFLSGDQFSSMLKSKTDLVYSVDCVSVERKEVLDAYFTPLIYLESTEVNSLAKYLIYSKIGTDPTVTINDFSDSLLTKYGQPFYYT